MICEGNKVIVAAFIIPIL